jgi:hypothetical protein
VRKLPLFFLLAQPLFAEVQIHFPSKISFSCSDKSHSKSSLRKTADFKFALMQKEDLLKCSGTTFEGGSFRLDLQGLFSALGDENPAVQEYEQEFHISKLTLRRKRGGGFLASGDFKHTNKFRLIQSAVVERQLNCELNKPEILEDSLAFLSRAECTFSPVSSDSRTYLLELINQTNIDDGEILGLLKTRYPDWAARLGTGIQMVERESETFFVSENSRLPFPPAGIWSPPGSSWLILENQEISSSVANKGLFELSTLRITVKKQTPNSEAVFLSLLEENLKALAELKSFQGRMRAIQKTQGKSAMKKSVVVLVQLLSDSTNLDSGWSKEKSLAQRIPSMLQTHLQGLDLYLKFGLSTEARKLRFDLSRLERLFSFEPEEQTESAPAHQKDILAMILRWSESVRFKFGKCYGLDLLPMILPFNDSKSMIPLPALKASKVEFFGLAMGGCK